MLSYRTSLTRGRKSTIRFCCTVATAVKTVTAWKDSTPFIFFCLGSGRTRSCHFFMAVNFTDKMSYPEISRHIINNKNVLFMRRTTSRFSLEERFRIVQEYESSNLTLPELCHKYGIKSISCVTNWRANFRKSGRITTFAPMSIPKDAAEEGMHDKTKAELEAELAQVKKDLEWVKLQNLALNTMIDIAEENGIRIRKKSGPSSRETVRAGWPVRQYRLQTVWPLQTGLVPAEGGFRDPLQTGAAHSRVCPFRPQ